MLKTFRLIRVFICIITAVIITGQLLPYPVHASEYSYILIEAETGTVLEEHNAYTQRNAGYMAKLMTLLIAAEDIETGKYSLQTEIKAPQAVNGLKGSVVWLEPGDSMTAEELLKSVIIGNANDAATALAVCSEQSVENFVNRMNSEAFDLGLRNTAFYSPQGYYNEKEYTTAYDMAKICSVLTGYEFLEPYFKTWRDFVKNETVELVNENTLSRTYDRHIGFKVSHSDEAGYCVAEGARSEDGTTYIAVVLGAPDEETALSTAKNLVKKGFSDYRVTVPGFLDEHLLPVKVRKGVDSAVEVGLQSQSAVVIPKGVSELSNVIVMPEYISAPVKKGQKVGTAAFYNGETLVYETAIIAKNSVEKLSYSYILKKMLLKVIEN